MSINQPDVNILVSIFDRLFNQSENTRLQIGADEPFYQAACDDQKAIIFAREDYFSSALHEIAHWAIAGEQRRKKDDFGYWYQPEGRTAEQQQQFEQVEIRPQAIEWILSLACNHTFHFSADNLTQEIDASDSFKESVYQQAKGYLDESLPVRAQLLFDQLNLHFRGGKQVHLSYV